MEDLVFLVFVMVIRVRHGEASQAVEEWADKDATAAGEAIENSARLTRRFS